MKVFLYYEDNEHEELHKTLKITLPKSWKTGPVSKLLVQFVESYNTGKADDLFLLVEADMHLSVLDADDNLVHLPSDAITQDVIADRQNVFVRHGAATTVAAIQEEEAAAQQAIKDHKKNTVACTHFGCKNRFSPGGPYPDCCHHVAPPVFHETAKFWSCCPTRKAYDWNDFEALKGCETGICTEIKQDEGQKMFLGGTDLREELNGGAELKSIDDFNKAEAAGGTNAAPVLERLQKALGDLGVESELYTQVVSGIEAGLVTEHGELTEAQLLEAVASELGGKLKKAMKAIAVDQLRIK
mmetsp:Transcript_29547/g.48757  ORF Transcript_29547/g.48757 Transcript_29547/m.48757 type:complete len:299 (-) Transcript_29547:25-921(-)